ncbi:MAG: glycosyltransferase family 39 protein [candidate division WOR-3 bacterium]
MKYKKYRRKPPRTSLKIPIKLLIFIFILTFLTRLLFILSMLNHAYALIPSNIANPIDDCSLALKLAQKYWFCETGINLGSLYAYFLKIISLLFGNKILVVQIIQAILSGFSAIFIYLITQKIANHRVGIIACILYLLTGILIFYTQTLLPVELSIFLSLWLVLLLLPITEEYSIKKIILAGIICGLLIILRFEFILLLILLLPYFIIKVRPRRILRYLIFVIFILIAVSIISLPKYLTTKKFVPYPTNLGFNFFLASSSPINFPYQPVALQSLKNSTNQFLTSLQSNDKQKIKPSEITKYWLTKTNKFIKENQSRYLKLLARKFLLFINNYEIPYHYHFYPTKDDSIILRIAVISYALLLPGAVLGIFLSLKSWKEFYLLYCLVLIYFVACLGLFSLSSFRSPVIPFFLIFSAFFIIELFNYLSAKRFISGLILIILWLGIFGLTQLKLVDKIAFNTNAYTEIGKIYQNNQRFLLAQNSYQKAITIKPDNIIAHYYLLQTYINLYNYQQADQELQTIKDIIQTHPYQAPYLHLAQAQINIAQRNFPQAIDELQQAINLNPNDAETHYLLGAIYITIGNNQKAFNEIQKALTLNPNHQDAQRAFKYLTKTIAPK